MAIVKRLSPEEKLAKRTDGSWKPMLAVPIIKQLVRPEHFNHVDTSPESISKIIAGFYERDWITKVPWNEKIFFYIYGMVARRADVPGLLDEERMGMLARHMNAQTSIDKIDQNEVAVGLAFRMALIFDLPTLLQRYNKPGSFTLPDLSPPPIKPLRKRLAKHRKS